MKSITGGEMEGGTGTGKGGDGREKGGREEITLIPL